MGGALAPLSQLAWRLRRHTHWGCELGATIAAAAVLIANLHGQQPPPQIDDITGTYEFLAPADTLALLEQDGQLKGYIDVLQGEEESDVVLSYSISVGKRTNDRVEFKTQTIHRKYYRFAGTVQRGKGQKETDPDYLRLIGELSVVTVDGETGQESVEQRNVVFKSRGRETEQDEPPSC